MIQCVICPPPILPILIDALIGTTIPGRVIASTDD